MTALHAHVDVSVDDPGTVVLAPALSPTRHCDRLRLAGAPLGTVLVLGAVDAALLLGGGSLAGRAPGWLVAVGLVTAAAWAALGLFRPRATMRVLDEVFRLAVPAGVVVLALAAFDVHGSRVIADLGLVVVLLLVSRTIGYPLLRAARRRGWWCRDLVVACPPEDEPSWRRRLGEHPELGLRLTGVVSTRRAGDRDDAAADPDLGQLLDNILSEARPQLLVIADPRLHLSTQTDVVDIARRRGVDLQVSSSPVGGPVLAASSRALRHRDRDEVCGIHLDRVRRPGPGPLGGAAKRLIDLAVASLMLAAAMPVMILVALCVRWELGGSPFFHQERVGRHGRTFTLYKFRSMPHNPFEHAWGEASSARLGPVGRFIRATSIDELPQLLNVLKGEMSLVGPRPEQARFVDELAAELPGYERRHQMSTGLTGLAAVNGLRGDTSLEDRILLDCRYVDSWSLGLDLRILLGTLVAVLRHLRG